MVAPKKRSWIDQRDASDERHSAERIDLLEMDPESPEFKEEAHLQAKRLAGSPTEAEDQAFIDSISMWPDEADE